MRPRTVRGDGHTGGMAGAAARTRRVGAMSGGPERRADLQAQPAARSAAWPGGEISSSAMVSRGGGHSRRSEEHTSELQSLMRISYAVFCLKKKIQNTDNINNVIT